MMYNKEAVLELIDRCPNLEFVKQLEPKKKGIAPVGVLFFACNLLIEDKKELATIVFYPDFPLTLPKILLTKYDALGFIPHIEPNGAVCYLEQESVYINIEEPEVVFQASIELSINTIIDGINGNNKADFREEFNAFWERNKAMSKLSIFSLIEVTELPKRISILKNDTKALLFEAGANTERAKKNFFKGKQTFAKTGIYLRLKEDCDLRPPKYDEQWTANDFVAWLKPKVRSKDWDQITQEILYKKPSKVEFVVIAIPRETGPTLLVAVHLKPKNDLTHPFLSTKSDWSLKYLSVERCDSSSYIPRGGAKMSLQNKKILLIGCGSVGSHLSKMLAQSGIGSLTLVDDDTIEMSNLQRFELGFDSLGESKVGAMKNFLEKNYLNLNVDAKQLKLRKYLDNEEPKLSDFDMVISTTGDPTINLYFNQLIKQLKPDLSATFLIGWNEPFGIGGHAVFSLADTIGCYRCLYRDGYNITSFASSDQTKPFHRKHLGCGEVFTPYSAMDSIRTSELMNRIVVDYFEGKKDKSEVKSWKGNDLEFVENGFELSKRYNQSQEELDINAGAFIDSECKHCSHL